MRAFPFQLKKRADFGRWRFLLPSRQAMRSWHHTEAWQTPQARGVAANGEEEIVGRDRCDESEAGSCAVIQVERRTGRLRRMEGRSTMQVSWRKVCLHRKGPACHAESNQRPRLRQRLRGGVREDLALGFTGLPLLRRAPHPPTIAAVCLLASEAKTASRPRRSIYRQRIPAVCKVEDQCSRD